MASTDTSESLTNTIRVTKSVVTTGTTGNAIVTPRHPCTVRLVCSSSSGSVQYSVSLVSEVRAGTATWDTWARGTVSATATDIPEGPITAVRGVSTSGAVTLEVCC